MVESISLKLLRKSNCFISLGTRSQVFSPRWGKVSVPFNTEYSGRLTKLRSCHQMCFGLRKKSLWHRCFPVNFAKFPRILFSETTSGRLLMKTISAVCITINYC